MDKQDTKAHLFPLSSQQAYTAVQSMFEFAFLLLRNNPSLAANDLFFALINLPWKESTWGSLLFTVIKTWKLD